jgi:uncharacterized protein YdeI (YjbR/CyaY-like superfamily)
MKITETFHPASRAGWRAWLRKNHTTADVIWIVYDKGAARNVTYAEAVEEALCYGWIDGIVKPIDEKQYAQRFTPRKNKTNWSNLNRKRFEAMEAAGLMTEAGRAVGPRHAAADSPRWTDGEPLPPFIDRALKGKARKNFEAMARGYRQQFVRFIIEAKQKETRKARLAKVVEKLVKNERPSM